ncbi:MAG: helix-hairpin-helix domain-containing protein [Proteobacteria bacterium]|nr:helix-hairpin-helix domain-containing protein [Pseudomonadota bacterium]
MAKININTATLKDLIPLPGIDNTLAERILKYRDAIGTFKNIEDIENVRGISETIMKGIRDSISIAKEDERVSEGLKISVVLSPIDKAGDYIGFRVMASGNRMDEDQAIIPFVATGFTSTDGKTEIVLPPKDKLDENLTFEVFTPDGLIVHSEVKTVKTLPHQLEFKVAPRTYGKTLANDDPNAGKPSRIRGRVFDEGGRTVPSLQVVIWGSQVDNPKDKDFFALVVANTDVQGNFTGPYPLGNYTAAHAAVALGDDMQNIIIHLEDGEFPKSILLPVDLPCPGEKYGDECEQKASTEPPRSPDNTDLARADGTFSSDPGAGRCVDFTKPDRTLEEFTYSYVVRTTEPSIKGFTLREQPNIDITKILGLLKEQTTVRNMERTMLYSANMGTINATEGIEIGQLEGIKVNAEILKTLARDPDGFSMATIMKSINRTNHVELQKILGRIAVKQPSRKPLNCSNIVDWDDDPTIYQACTIAHGHVLRFKQEWVADGYSMGNLLYSLPLAPGQKKQISVIDWERRESATRSEILEERESLDASISRDRDISDVVSGTVNESMRGGSKSSSGSVAGGIGIGAILGPVGGLLGVGGGHASASSSSWQNSSRSTAASALNQLRDRTIQSASSVRSQRSSVVQTVQQGERVRATTETVANYNHCHAITIQYFEVLRHLLLRHRLTDVQECLFVPLMMSWFTDDKALRWKDTISPWVPRALRRGFGALDRIENNYEGSDFPLGRYADEQLLSVDGDLRLRFQIARPKDDENDEFDPNSWSPLLKLFGFTPQDFYNSYLKNQNYKDRIFLEHMGSKIASTVVGQLRIEALKNDGSLVNLNVDPTLITTFRNDRELYVTLRMQKDPDPVNRADIKAVIISSRLLLPGLPFVVDALPAGSRVIVESGSMSYTTAHHQDYLFASRSIKNDLTGYDDVRIQTPLNRRELRNPREEDKELARNLLDYLNEHIERYHHIIWYRMSDARRYMLLDGFQAPNAGGRSVASVVENELIGIVGNCLVMPVSWGYHLDPTFNQDAENPINLLEHYEPNTPIEPSRVALPTRGVYAEAVKGACNSCEIKDETRFWRWEESPIPDSPPAILPVSMDTRRAEPPNLETKDFPSPIIAMQSAPAAPDPAGLAGVLTLLGQSGIFRDMAGLEGTQKNVAAALEQAFSTATTFGTKAADLALQGKMVKDIDKAMRTIQTARKDGLINDAQASQLTETAIRGLVGSGTTNPPKATTTDEVKDITKAAGDNKASVKVNRPTGEKVEVDARPTDGESTLTAAVADFFGLSADTKPKARPDRTKDLPVAIALVNAFKKGTGSGKWTNLDRSDVADGLITLINDPDKVNQGSIGVCGPAVFFNIWIEADPVSFARYGIAIYENGEAAIGTLTVKAGSDLRAQDYKVLAGKMNPVVPPADWMVMSALRDSENGFFDFEGTPQEDFSGGTTGGEVASWFRATGLFSNITDDTPPNLKTIDLDHAKKLNPTANRKIVMNIDTNMIRPAKQKGKGKHFIALRSKVTELPNGDIDFSYWTWGSPPESVTQPLTKARFEDTYLGAISCEF